MSKNINIHFYFVKYHRYYYFRIIVTVIVDANFSDDATSERVSKRRDLCHYRLVCYF